MAIPVVSVADVVTTESAGFAEFVFRLDAPSTEPVSLRYQSKDGSAKSAAAGVSDPDFIAVGRYGYETLTFAAGETVKTVRVAFVDDTAPEPAESFQLQVLLPEGLKIGTSLATATILDDQSSLTGLPVLSVEDTVIDEKAGHAYFAVTLDRPSTSPVSLTYRTAQGTAVVGTDYEGLTARTLTFAAGERAKTVAINLIDDDAREDGEYFDLLLTEVSGALIPDTRGRAIIGSSDRPVSATPVVSVADIVADESKGYAEFVFRLDAPSTEPVSLRYQSKDGSAKSAAAGVSDPDFIAVGRYGYETLTFAPGETVENVRVALVDDATSEPAESFQLQLLLPQGLKIGTSLATATLLDDQSTLTGLPVVAIEDAVVDEKGGRAYFTVTLDRPSTSAVSLTYQTADGTAAAGADYQALAPQTIVFAPGARASTVAVNLLDDATQEEGEYFDLVLSDASGAQVPDTRARAYIGSSDRPVSATPVVSVADIVADESKGYAEFVFRLDAPSSEPVSLRYHSKDGSAKSAAAGVSDPDFIAVGRYGYETLTFAPGETVKTVRVGLVDDAAPEPAESFQLQLLLPQGLKIGTSLATATIKDDDSQVDPGPLKDTRTLTGGNLVWTMARFARAAYSLRPDEPRTDAANSKFLNDPYYSYDGGARKPLEETILKDLSKDGWFFLDARQLNPELRIAQTSDPYDFHTGVSGGIYTNGNAAALVARSKDALVIAFRGTNDGRYAHGLWDPREADSPDQDHWIDKKDHWKLFSPLDSAINNYLKENPELKNVYLTGHSLGAAMVQPFLDAHRTSSGVAYKAITFASPGYGVGFLEDDRISNFWIAEDPIGKASPWGENEGDNNTIFVDVKSSTPFDNAERHSMALYLYAARQIQAASVGLDTDPNGRLTVGGIGYDSIAVGAEAIHHVNGMGADDDDFSFRVPTRGWTSGSQSASLVLGTEASDRLTGDEQDQLVIGLGGSDVLSGGPGTDTAVFRGAVGSYRFNENELEVSVSGPDGTDTVSKIERLSFGDLTFSIADRSRFNPLHYLNQNRDVAAAGIDPLTHYRSSGWAEGRDPSANVHLASVNGLEYIASYGDLMGTFGVDKGAGYRHFATAGLFEGRTITFNGLEYIAAFGDLMNVFGASADAGAAHYIQAGRFEGRSTTFDGLEYVASYGDLIKAFGANPNAGAGHYIQAGRFEGRTVSFDGLEYIASYGDLINAFHNQVAANPDPDIGAEHYVLAGYFEKRAPDRFDAGRYLANYSDLRSAFGTNTQAATIHYITAGYFEGRTA